MTDTMTIFDQAFDCVMTDILSDVLMSKHEKSTLINDLFEVRRMVKQCQLLDAEWNITA